MIPALVLVALLGVWEAFVRLRDIDELLLPAPSAIAQALWEDRALLGDDLLVTLTEIAAGLAAAVAVGVLLALAMHQWPVLGRALHPLVVGSQAVPIPVIAPLLLFALGFGLAPKVLVIALISFFPLTVSLYDGLRGVDADQRKLFRALGASRWQTLRWLEIPSALPRAFSGLKVAAAVSVIGAVFAEWTGSSSGLGNGLLVANGQLAVPRAYAASFLLFVLAIALYGAIALAERRILRWAPRHDQTGGP